MHSLSDTTLVRRAIRHCDRHYEHGSRSHGADNVSFSLSLSLSLSLSFSFSLSFSQGNTSRPTSVGWWTTPRGPRQLGCWLHVGCPQEAETVRLRHAPHSLPPVRGFRSGGGSAASSSSSSSSGTRWRALARNAWSGQGMLEFFVGCEEVAGMGGGEGTQPLLGALSSSPLPPKPVLLRSTQRRITGCAVLAPAVVHLPT